MDSYDGGSQDPDIIIGGQTVMANFDGATYSTYPFIQRITGAP